MTDGRSDEERVRALREVLTASGAGIYLATHVAGPLTAETMTAVHDADELELRLGRVGPDRAEDLELREWEARAAVAAALRVSFERVVLAHGAPEAACAIALHVLARRDALESTLGELGRSGRPHGGPAPRILVLEGVAEPIVRALESVARAVGGPVDRLASMPEIVSRDVALVVMAHVDPLGRLAEPRAVAATAHRAGARLVVDVSLSVGALPVDVAELGADALIGEVHHWLLGPEGLAFAWLAPALGMEAATELRSASGAFARGPLLALARSVGWLLMYVELPWVVARTGRLARRLYDSLATIGGVELLAERSRHGPLLAFRVGGWESEQAAEELSRSCHAITDVDAAADALRVSVGAWNRDDELDRFTVRVAELAGHTPATLPRRPSLTILSRTPDDDR